MLFQTTLVLLVLQTTSVASVSLRRGAIPLTVKTFDYVVVGGGTAGSVMATRLAQNDFEVALIEAGGHYELESLAEFPAADALSMGSDPTFSSPEDWGFVARDQSGANGRSIHFARGKCLGGSSALNFMVYQRPTRESMDVWATTVNDSSYEFDEVLSFYKKSVQFSPPNTDYRVQNASADFDVDAYDSDGGPLQVSYANFAEPFSSWMSLGMEAIGIDQAKDFVQGNIMGAQYCASTIDPANELRSSSEQSFLSKIRPKSLTTYTNTLAKKVVFDENNRATGVQVKGLLGDLVVISASEEVIISAGAFQSPQLLMVSGIGPIAHLEEHGIDVIADRPGVGQNMWDHPFFAPSYRVRVTTFTKFATDLMYAAGQIAKMLLNKKGVVTNPIADFLAWEKIPRFLSEEFSEETKSKLANFPSDWPEAEYMSGAGYMGNVSNLLAIQPKDGYQYASILGVLITPMSRGNVTLKSADTSDLPVINPNWLDDEADQEVAIAMFKRIRQAFQSEAMQPVVIGEEYNPGPHVHSDDQVLEFIKNNVMTLWHPSCTCKMGTSDDDMAVVDSQARVYGVDGLRVVDASIFPFLPPGHPQSTVYMLAEKIAAEIIRDS
ncbi:CAZyme family AA3 [Penicillium roqueforti]|uniref:Glucose-methanol-choline oxidoreductase n=1 Tax=Penicillium roqueforti (strain FM164) TaxID=1365484 RepID=W6QIN3_PENRF|nr:CAZyme family AA3 [Penicillium roqueforti]CDM35856.1 Glucose-methanol-choline oxidoreductase [Penicillium roqueforti FM164]KAI2678924.1 CAZyme family AA3 [Penicillium roqueforti]KAI2698943.1 CAZyme family AA3 [Penicillium roqueforti]KAI2716534.1 CAZyme family AA3 [Penicillium roqueforti]